MNPRSWLKRRSVATRVVAAASALLLGGTGGIAATEASWHLNSYKNWGGGPVQHNHQIDLIFWGPSFQKGGDNEHLIDYTKGFVTSLNGSAYLAPLDQYKDWSGGVSANVSVNDVVVDPNLPTQVDGQAINSEIAMVSKQRHWQPNPDTDVMIVADPNVNWVLSDQDCAYHDYIRGNPGWVFGFVPVPNGPGCNPYWGTEQDPHLAEDALTRNFTHELVEEWTDPRLNGYTFPITAGGKTLREEVGDLCDYPEARSIKATWRGYPVPFYYSLATKSCVGTNAKTAPPPDKGQMVRTHERFL